MSAQLPSEPPPAALWDRLPELDQRLRAAGIRAGVDRWQSAHDLIALMAGRGELPDDRHSLCSLLAPLFCSSPDEQRTFSSVYADWAGEPARSPRAPGSGPPQYARARRRLVPRSPAPARVLIMVSALAALVAVGVIAYRQGDVATPPGPPDPGVSSSLPGPSTAEPTDDDAYLDLPLQRIPARTPVEVIPRPEAHVRLLIAADWLVPALPLALVLAGLALAALGSREVLRRRRGDAASPLRHITLAEQDDDLFDGPAVRAALRRLHTPVAFPTSRLDERATVERTTRAAGLFTPVHRDQPRVPDCVVLVDFHHGSDHVADLAETLVRRLADAGIETHRYYYRRRPMRVLTQDGRSHDLERLATRHPDARLLLVAEPQDLVDPRLDRPGEWLALLEAWPRRGLLAARAAPERWRRTLADTGLAVAPFDDAGVARIVDHLGGFPSRAATSEGPRLPRSLTQAATMTDDAPDAARRRALLTDLDTWLGPRGVALLTAVAVYPELHPGLTRVIDRGLFPHDAPDERAQRMLRLARLPWLRMGRLPDWLRLALRERTAPRRVRIIAALYRELLLRASVDGEEAVRLELRVSKRPSWRERRWLRWLRVGAPPGAALEDRIFLDTVVRPRLLDFALPYWLSRLLPRPRRVAGWPLAATGAVLLAALAHVVWQGWAPLSGLRQQAEQALDQLEARARRGFEVQVLHTAETASVAARLTEVLVSAGYGRVERESLARRVPLAGEDALPAPLTNTVQIGAASAGGAAAYLRERLRYLTWGEPPQIADRPATLPPWVDPARAAAPDPATIRVWLLRAGHGGVFTDPLVRTLTAEERAAFRDSTTLSLPLPVEAPRPTPVSRFRDALRDGGEGPEMIHLAGGGFRMGSPEDEAERSSGEGPVRTVTVAPFAIGRTEVTFADYDRFAAAMGRALPDDEGWGRGELPVINVSWQDATAYAAWLSEQTGQAYRLASEAEWEFAARAGTEAPFWTGPCIDTSQANYDGNFDYADCGAKTGVYRSRTVAAGSLPASAWGLHEVSGNVWEWVADCWHDSYSGAPVDGRPWLESDGGECSRRVVRGGGWFNSPRWLRSANRFGSTAGGAGNDVGFRLARTP